MASNFQLLALAAALRLAVAAPGGFSSPQGIAYPGSVPQAQAAPSPAALSYLSAYSPAQSYCSASYPLPVVTKTVTASTTSTTANTNVKRNPVPTTTSSTAMAANAQQSAFAIALAQSPAYLQSFCSVIGVPKTVTVTVTPVVKTSTTAMASYKPTWAAWTTTKSSTTTALNGACTDVTLVDEPDYTAYYACAGKNCYISSSSEFSDDSGCDAPQVDYISGSVSTCDALQQCAEFAINNSDQYDSFDLHRNGTEWTCVQYWNPGVASDFNIADSTVTEVYGYNLNGGNNGENKRLARRCNCGTKC